MNCPLCYSIKSLLNIYCTKKHKACGECIKQTGINPQIGHNCAICPSNEFARKKNDD